ncbi:MAG: ROK family protein [Clostridia bacterium]|nr:ROK family protein [Clostridia bacterium]
MLSIGFDIGGTTVKAGAVDEQFRIVRKLSCPTPFGEAEALADMLRGMAEELAPEGCAAAGVTVPGSIDCEGGIIDAWNIGLHNVPLKKMMEERLGVGVAVRNDADAAAAAELKLGALKGVRTGLMLTLGTGVGGSIILNGELFRGGLGRGTELGHAVMERGGLKCGCGHRGCIETLCSASALTRKAEAASKEEGMIRVRAEAGEKPDAKLLIECAREGDAAAIALFDEYTDALADAAASFVNVLDPEVIVFGGGVSGAGELLVDALRKKIPPRTFFGSCGRITTASAGNDAGILGSLI